MAGKLYKLIEDRGCGIRYTEMAGTIKDCVAEKRRLLAFQSSERETDEQWNWALHNGDGQPFSYHIEVWDTDDAPFKCLSDEMLDQLLDEL